MREVEGYKNKGTIQNHRNLSSQLVECFLVPVSNRITSLNDDVTQTRYLQSGIPL